MKIFYGLILSILFVAPLFAQSEGLQAIFTTVKGDVKIQTPNRVLMAQVDLTVNQGDQITTAADSSAVLKLFDGSKLTIAPSTQFTLTALQKPSENDKVIKFSMLWGTLSALVTKLTTAHSSFELESGGVVCGVRGTDFSMTNSGGKNPNVTIQVREGSVWTADSFGNHSVLHRGEHMSFLNGARVNGSGSGNGPKQGSKSIQVGNSGSNSGNGSNSGSGANSGTGSNSGPSSNSDNGGNPGAGSNGGTGSTSGNAGSASGTDTGNGSSANGNSGNSANAGSGNASGNGPSVGSGTSGGPVPGPSTGANTGSFGNPSLNLLNNQFQNNVLINGDNNLTNPTVQQAIQLNVNLVIGQ